MDKSITIQFIFLSALLCFGLSCSNSGAKEHSDGLNAGNQTDTLVYDEIEKTMAKEERAKFYVVEKKAIIFFMISKKEYQRLLIEMGDSYRWDAEALFNNFYKQANTFQALIKKQKINCIISTSEKFEIRLNNGKKHIFDRIEKDQLIGQILTDGVQEPVVEFGMFNNQELTQLIEGFFKISSLGFVPEEKPDSAVINEQPVEEKEGM